MIDGGQGRTPKDIERDGNIIWEAFVLFCMILAVVLAFGIA